MATSRPNYGDLTIEELWQAAEDSFQRTTGKSLKASTKITIEGTMAQLDAKYKSTKSDESARKKRIVFNVLKVIENLGGIAVQGVSMVFGPAQLCFNALSFLLDIPPRVESVFGGVSALLEAIQGYFAKLNIMKRIEAFSKLDPELLRSIHVILVSFVDICTLAHKLALGSKTAKFKAGTLAVLYHDDAGMSTALKQFNDLINQQNDIVGLLSYEHTSTIVTHTRQLPAIAAEMAQMRDLYTGGMETLVLDAKSRSLDKIAEEQRSTLVKALDINLDTLKEQEEQCERIRMDSLPDSGSELLKDKSFLQWADFTSDTKGVLFLEGKPQSGKTYLVHAVLEAIKVGAVSTDEKNEFVGRTMTGRYSFKRQDDRTMNTGAKLKNRNEPPMETALKHMCLQVAQQHKGYAREMANMLKEFTPRGKSIQELWKRLLLGHPRGDVVHVLVFDALDQISERDRETLFQILDLHLGSREGLSTAFPSRSKVRILISGTPESFPRGRFIDTPLLNAADLNAVNTIKSFIGERIKQEKLWQENTSGTRALLDFIEQELPHRSEGDFGVIVRALDNVKQAVQDGEGLDKAKAAIIEACEYDQITIASRVVDDLSESLNIQDIQRLNSLLMWTTWNDVGFPLECMRAIFFLESRDSPVQSFEAMMRTKFSRIFIRYADNWIVLRKEIADYIRKTSADRARTKQVQESGGPTISMEIKINNASFAQIRSFLWNLNEKANFDPSIFMTADDQLMNKTVEAPELESKVHVTIKFLELLNDEFDEITEVMFRHAVFQINGHLREIIGQVTRLDAEALRTILSGIIAVLTDIDILELHNFSPLDINEAWLTEDEEESDHVVSRWLNCSEAVELLDRRDRRRLKKLLEPGQGYMSFYRPLTLSIARRWLQAGGSNPGEAYEWIDGFLESEIKWSRRKQQHPPNQMRRVGSDESIDTLPPPAKLLKHQKVDRALAWVKDNLPDVQENDVWYQRLGETYIHLQLRSSAVNAFEKGKSLSHSNWHLFAGSAAAYGVQGAIGKAIEEALKGLEMIRKQVDKDLNVQRDYVAQIWQLAKWYIRAQQFQSAIDECRAALQVSPNDYTIHYLLLDAAQQLGDKELLRVHLMITLAEMDETRRTSKLIGLLASAVECFLVDKDILTFETIALAARDADCVPTLLESLRRLNTEATSNNNVIINTVAKLFESFMLGSLTTLLEPESLERAIDIVNDIITTPVLSEQYEVGILEAVTLFHESHDYLAHLYFTSLMDGMDGDRNEEQDIEGLRDIIKTSKLTQDFLPDGCTYLAAYYACEGEEQKAKELLRPFLEEALEMLSDETTTNDPDGFYYMALILGYAQDDYNSLTAWSLLTPPKGLDHFAMKRGREYYNLLPEPTVVSDAGSNNHENNEQFSAGGANGTHHSNLSKSTTIPAELNLGAFRLVAEGSVSIIKPPAGSSERFWIRAATKYIIPEVLTAFGLRWDYDKDDYAFVIIREALEQDMQREVYMHSRELIRRRLHPHVVLECRGRCEKRWTYASNIYACKYCRMVLLCQDCLEKVRDPSKGYMRLCSPNHEWLHVPKWSNERYSAVGRDNVLIDGVIGKDGHTTGGRAVSVQDWLNLIRTDWGIMSEEAEFLWRQPSHIESGSTNSGKYRS